MTKQVLDSLQAGLSADLLAFLPELILCGTIVLLLVLRLFRHFDRQHLGWWALVLTFYALVVAFNQWLQNVNYDPRRTGQPLELFSGLLIYDNFSIFLKLFLLGFATLMILLCLIT